MLNSFCLKTKEWLSWCGAEPQRINKVMGFAPAKFCHVTVRMVLHIWGHTHTHTHGEWIERPAWAGLLFMSADVYQAQAVLSSIVGSCTEFALGCFNDVSPQTLHGARQRTPIACVHLLTGCCGSSGSHPVALTACLDRKKKAVILSLP